MYIFPFLGFYKNNFNTICMIFTLHFIIILVTLVNYRPLMCIPNMLDIIVFIVSSSAFFLLQIYNGVVYANAL